MVAWLPNIYHKKMSCCCCCAGGVGCVSNRTPSTPSRTRRLLRLSTRVAWRWSLTTVWFLLDFLFFFFVFFFSPKKAKKIIFSTRKNTKKKKTFSVVPQNRSRWRERRCVRAFQEATFKRGKRNQQTRHHDGSWGLRPCPIDSSLFWASSIENIGRHLLVTGDKTTRAKRAGHPTHRSDNTKCARNYFDFFPSAKEFFFIFFFPFRLRRLLCHVWSMSAGNINTIFEIPPLTQGPESQHKEESWAWAFSKRKNDSNARTFCF